MSPPSLGPKIKPIKKSVCGDLQAEPEDGVEIFFRNVGRRSTDF
jgi:hypothetical protein